MKYYQIIHKSSGIVMCYVSTDGDITDICDIFGDEYCAEDVTKEEFEREERED